MSGLVLYNVGRPLGRAEAPSPNATPILKRPHVRGAEGRVGAIVDAAMADARSCVMARKIAKKTLIRKASAAASDVPPMPPRAARASQCGRETKSNRTVAPESHHYLANRARPWGREYLRHSLPVR